MGTDSGGSAVDGASLVTGGLAVITTAAGLIGTFTGALPRLIRNDSAYFALSLTLALLAIALSFTASQLPSAGTTVAVREVPDGAVKETTTTTSPASAKRPWLRIGLSVSSLAAFAGAAVVLTRGLDRSLNLGDQPRLSATWAFPAGQQPVATVHMQVDDLAASTTVHTTVVSVGRTGLVGTRIYVASTGADEDGTADETFDVSAPDGAHMLIVDASIGGQTACPGDPPRRLNGHVLANGPPAQRFACLQLTVPVKPGAS